jgi:hypothetical protein
MLNRMSAFPTFFSTGPHQLQHANSPEQPQHVDSAPRVRDQAPEGSPDDHLRIAESRDHRDLIKGRDGARGEGCATDLWRELQVGC